MSLDSLIDIAKRRGASDLHLEAGLPPAVRVRGALEMQGSPISGAEIMTMARSLVGEDDWQSFIEQRSFDMSATVSGIRCRFNILKSARGVGMAIRLLMPFRATIDRLNLHPDLKEIANFQHGLVIVSGPTGCGKSSTVAALVQEINCTKARHIITVESPIEHNLRSKFSLIRQREVGRDTPSFERALIDALREDPDVIVVGEMRDPETMRLTLNAAETGHLVFATVHSSTCGEALQRIVSAFPAETQDGVRAQLADSISAVICQRLVYRPDIKLRVPECEILFSSLGVNALIRDGKFSKLADAMQTGSSDHMWTFPRYRSWLDSRSQWHIPNTESSESDLDADDRTSAALPRLPSTAPRVPSTAPRTAAVGEKRIDSSYARRVPAGVAKPVAHEDDGVIEIDGEEDLEDLVKHLDRKK